MWISCLNRNMGTVFIIEMLAALCIFTRKFQKRDHFRLRVALSIGVLLLVSTVSDWLAIRVSSEQISYYVIGTFFLMFLLASLAVAICFQATPYDVIFCGVAVWAVQNALYQSTMIMEVGLKLSGMDLLQYPFFSVLLLLLCHGATYFCVYRWTFPRQRQHYTVEKGSLLALSCVVLVVVLRVLPLPENTSVSHHMAWIFLHILVDVLSLYIMFGMSENNVMKTELATLQKMWRLKEEHYEQSKQITESINLKCHDLRYQISALRQELGQGTEQEALQEIENAVMIYDSIAKTGNEALDTILTEKSLYCEKNGIRLTYMVDGERLRFIRPLDIYVIFGNALDNAIESVMKLPESEQRVITLTVTGGDRFVVFQIQNTYAGELQIVDGLPMTSKEDAENHGFGVKSIQILAQKYGGDMTFSAENGIFSMNILLSTT